MKVTGNCLCGKLSYEANTNKAELYQCHCSKCRRATGSSANANLIVKLGNFNWINEPTTLKQYIKDNWVSSFCSECGAKAPIKDKANDICYIPAGSLHQHQGLAVTSHIYVGSKAGWDVIGGSALQKDKM
ncbi:MAG: GFA family protein [Pseudomonadales bacterium]|nr:GFA family protein [Pseudomonadales bacterium]